MAAEQRRTKCDHKSDSRDELCRQLSKERTIAETPFSAFSRGRKRWIVAAASFAAMFSGLSSFIYYPIIRPLSTALHVSVEQINLTITAYQVVSGIAPSLLGDMADQTGRRPVYIFALLIYTGANIGLALQKSYPGLVLLRMVQSVGSSGTIAFAYGVIADIATPAERGTYVGMLMGFTNAAPSLGPVLGGILAERAGWRWTFWLLVVLSGLTLTSFVLCFPETSRKLVGDGSTRSDTCFPIGKPNWSLKSRANKRTLGPRRRLRLPNPLSCLRVLWNANTASVIFVGSIYYSVFCCLAASLSSLCIELYHLNYLQAGLMYLPSGIGGIIAAYSTGKLLDYDYRRTAKEAGHEINTLAGDDLQYFPIEKARLRSIWYPIIIAITATIGYGWALQVKTHIAVTLVLQFFNGASMVGTFVICGTLLTDLNPAQSATAQASYNLVRCTLAGGALAALQALNDAVGVGWCFSIYAGFCAVAVPMLWMLRAKGMVWRQQKLERAGIR